MTDPAPRHTTAPPAPAPDGSAVPARLRITAWIVLATALGLGAVLLTLRSTLAADVQRTANEEVLQEVDEFRTFAARGRDPETNEPFATASRLLQLHLERQFPGDSQVLVGVDTAAAARGDSPLLVQGVRDRLQVADPAALVRGLLGDPATSGTFLDDDGTPVRWGRVAVEPGGAFLVFESTGPALAEVRRISRLVLGVSLGGLLVTAGIAWVVAGQILAPVRDVRRAAARITRVDLSRRIDVRGRDDVAALASVVNAMLDRLQAAFRAQRRSAAAASVSLRAPLAVLAQKAGADPAAARAAAQATAVLDDLELLADAARADFVSPAPVDVGHLLDEVALRARTLTGREVAVVERWDGVGLLDADKIHAALLRLARNAAQVTPENSVLRLGARHDADGGALELYVGDDGPGLTDEAASCVLERFADGAGTSGPGLGLAVVRAVADAHDASAWVETELGRGSTFGLRLPLRPARVEGPSPLEVEPARADAS